MLKTSFLRTLAFALLLVPGAASAQTAVTTSTDRVYDANTAMPLTQTLGGRLRVDSTGDSLSVISSANSSTTPLAVSGVFTGTATSTLGAGAIAVSSFSNVASATDGLSIQQSPDGTNWDITDVYTITTGNFLIPVKAAFMRVVYTNGGTIQAAFRLQTTLKPQMPVASAFRPADAQSIQNDFPGGLSIQQLYNGTTIDLTRSAINATNSTGTGIAAVGLTSQLDDTTPTTITENQFGNLRMTGGRALITNPYASTAEQWSYAAVASGIVSSTADVAVKASAGAGLRNYIRTMTIAHDVLSAVSELVVKDGATVLYRGKLQTPAQESETVVFDPPLRGTAATAVNVAMTVSATGGVFVNLQGFTGP